MKKVLKQKSVKMLMTTLALVGVMGLAGGCGGNDTPAPGSQGASEPAILVTGSTSVEPLALALGDQFTQANGTKVQVQGNGSSAGITATIDGSASIGMSSRELKAEEKSQGLVEHIIAIDGIAVVVNNANQVSDLTSAQIQDIFSGKITNWKDLGGADSEILLCIREAGSGTRDAFEELTGLKDKVDESKAIISDSTNAISQNVAGKPNAIGYISLGSLSTDVKAVSVDGVTCNTDDVKNGSYKIQRNFLLLTKGEATGTAKAYIDFVLSEAGKTLIQQKGFITK